MSTNGDAPTEPAPTPPDPMDCDPPSLEGGANGDSATKPPASTDASSHTSDPLLGDTTTSDSDNDFEPQDGEPAAKSSSSKSPEDKLVKAVNYKDRGNKCIAEGDSASALKHYERGIKIASGVSSDEQAKALLVSLRLNLALACTKEERFADAAAAATKVVEVDPANVKALFRRGVARARIGMLEDARADLLAVIKADPRNGGAKKELKVLKERISEHRQKEKESYTGLFDKGPMYNDKELERQKREAEAAKRLKVEQEEWGKDNEKRKAEGNEEQTLEDWRKEKKEAEEKAKKERDEKEKLKTRPATPAAPPRAAVDINKEGSDEMELDEEDLKIIQDTKKKGYCYFKRTLSEKDQSLLDAEQMKLRARVSPATVPEKGEDAAAAVADPATRSAWNEAGTWEEVDKTDWCKGKLTEALGKVAVAVGKDAINNPEYLMEKLTGFDFAAGLGEGSGGKGLEALGKLKTSLAKLSASVTNVEIVGGDAHVICVSNKIKHIFDFNVKLKFSLEIDESMGLPMQAEGVEGKPATSVKRYKGTLTFPDMTNSDVDNGRFDSEPELKWDKKARWEAAYNDRVTSCTTELKAGILAALGAFFTEYKNS